MGYLVEKRREKKFQGDSDERGTEVITVGYPS
jgi:hypothetical protein